MYITHLTRRDHRVDSASAGAAQLKIDRSQSFGSGDEQLLKVSSLPSADKQRGRLSDQLLDAVPKHVAETFVRKLGLPIPVIMVNESGASVYSASEAAREEFPTQETFVLSCGVDFFKVIVEKLQIVCCFHRLHTFDFVDNMWTIC